MGIGSKVGLSMQYCRNADVSVRLSPAGALLYHPDTAKELQLNETGLFIWNHLSGKMDSEGD